jgi:hypothetical protein
MGNKAAEVGFQIITIEVKRVTSVGKVTFIIATVRSASVGAAYSMALYSSIPTKTPQRANAHWARRSCKRALKQSSPSWWNRVQQRLLGKAGAALLLEPLTKAFGQGKLILDADLWKIFQAVPDRWTA